MPPAPRPLASPVRIHIRRATQTHAARPPRDLERARYPFPAHADPTPREIFHLPPGASQAQVKERYIALVRAHHPDAHPDAPAVAHARFRAVQAAYDVLAGRARGAPPPPEADAYVHELARRRRAWDATHRPDDSARAGRPGPGRAHTRGFAEGFGPRGPNIKADAEWREDGARERAVLAFGVALLLVGLFPSAPGALLRAVWDAPPAAHLSEGEALPPQPPPPPPQTTTTTTTTTTTAPAARLLPDLDRGHRAAAAALAQARVERAELGPERRAGVRRRVRGDEGDRGGDRG